ncbi:hypothetical protein BaRGS_00025912 [Batillaria attramentaria]|uniref:Uncharacterized protein n=1 Tax=Batillaria attramentaria TaxID=370345 RepID=A0ABD0K6X5_9CAEN
MDRYSDWKHPVTWTDRQTDTRESREDSSDSGESRQALLTEKEDWGKRSWGRCSVILFTNFSRKTYTLLAAKTGAALRPAIPEMFLTHGRGSAQLPGTVLTD